MNISGKKCLVTGAGGFIGSHLVEGLIRKGCRVTAMVRYSSSGDVGLLRGLGEEILDQVEILRGDVRDAGFMDTAVRSSDVVFNLAALIGIPYSYHAPQSYIDTNINGALNVLQAAREDGRLVVQTSTSEVYGTAQHIPMSEEHPLNAQSPYAATKVGADQLALSFHRSFGVPVTVVRPFNTFGPRQSSRAVIPSIILQLLRGDGEISLGALHPTRDFCYVRDTVAGFMAVAESDKAMGEVVNIGTGCEHTIRRTAELTGEIVGKPVRFSQEGKRMRPAKSEVERLCADVSKAAELAGWTPEYGGEEGFRRALEESVDWFANNLDASCYGENFRL